MFHAALLTPYHETDEHGPNYIKPPPDLIDGEEEHEVEAIITHKPIGNKFKVFTLPPLDPMESYRNPMIPRIPLGI